MQLNLPHRVFPRPRQKLSSGFSLLELLVVLAIIAILTVPVIVSFRLIQERSLDSVADGISSKLRLAQLYAQSNGTYAWVGIQNYSNGGIAMTLWASKDGTSTMSATNLTVVSAATLYKNASLNTFYTDSDLTVINISMSDLATIAAPGTFNSQINGSSFSYSQIVQFAPSGASTIHATQSVPWIELPLVKMAGTIPIPTATPTLIRISGLTGRVVTVSN